MSAAVICARAGLALLAIAGPTSAVAGSAVTPWRPGNVTSPRFESHPAFDPLNGDLYFVRSAPDFTGWRILVSRCGEKGWLTPEEPSFAGSGVEADPYFVDGGRRLYFISSRPADGVEQQDLDIWRVDRGAGGSWGAPERLPEPVNSPGNEWFPRPASDGWLYFGSNREGGQGKTDLWRARQEAGTWRVENLGPGVNTAADEYEPQPSADSTRLVVMAEGGLHQSNLGPNGWGALSKLGPEININGSEIGALLSPSGRSMLFARDTGAGDSGELFLYRSGGEEAWPPACPPRGGAPRSTP